MEKIYLEPIRVAYTSSFGNPSESDAFVNLESIVPLKGNKFYATYNPQTQEYCACVKIDSDEQVRQHNLPTKMLDGGWFASAELQGPFSEIIKNIASTFDFLARNFTIDTSRLPIEFYKRHTHIILYLPISY